MRIKVKPEGREEIYIPEKESLKTWISSKGWEAIHNFLAGGSMMIGADHDIASVLVDIDNADKVGILLGKAKANNIGHALAVIKGNRLEMFDIGNVTINDLEVIENEKQ